jgi:hypothetical protein
VLFRSARSKSKTPVQYFANVNEGATWIAKFVDVGSVETFAKEVEEVRALLNKYP